MAEPIELLEKFVPTGHEVKKHNKKCEQIEKSRLNAGFFPFISPPLLTTTIMVMFIRVHESGYTG